MSATGGSGSLLADKRYAYGVALATEGDFAAAADLFAQAAEQAPGWAPAFLAQGLALEKAGLAEAALAAFEGARARDAHGLLGADLHIARLRGSRLATMSTAYVATLFDQYAPRFDAHLTGTLRYRGPQVIVDAIGEAAPGLTASAVLDLGCGTGLMARALASPGRAIDGIDLSHAMLGQAEGSGLYRHLWAGDCEAVMRGLPAGGYGLVVAADVLVYIGDLLPLFAETARVLAPEGFFAATLQAWEQEDYGLGPDLRFQHGADHLQRCLAAAKLKAVLTAPCVTRSEGGEGVPGLVFVACRS